MQRSVKFFIAVLGLLVVVNASATIIQVPADQPTLQAAINATSNGDTVIVAPGRYYENVNFRTKQIVVASRYLLTNDPNDIWATILDGSTPANTDTGSVVIIAGGQDSTTALIGFTLTGGRGTKWKDVSDNKIYREGGAILTEASNPLIMNNIIINNRANEKGGGVASAGGGGIRCGFGPIGRTPYIIGNVFAYNTGLYGGALVAFHCPSVIKNNVFWKNSGGQDFGGAGLWVWNSGGLTIIENNTVIGNTTTNQGGGIFVNGADADIRNNIIRGNTGFQPNLSVGGGIVTVSYNDIEGGYAGTGNVDQNPLFAPTNLYLTPVSPCVDSGDADPAYNDREDPANLGFALFPALGALRNDKGAYGGLTGRAFPVFTAPELTVPVDSIDFGTVTKESFTVMSLYLDKKAYGPVTIDSIRFGHTTKPDLYNTTNLPMVLPIPPTYDSVQLLWNPMVEGTLLDTARVYHKDSSTVNPLLVIVTGKVSCCVGTTGNVNGAGVIDLSDLSFLIAYLTSTPRPTLPCLSSANINRAGVVDLSDLSTLIAYLTSPPGSITLPACP